MATGNGVEMRFFQSLSLTPDSVILVVIEQSGIFHSQIDGNLNQRQNCD